MEELCIFVPSEPDLQGISLSTIQEKRFVIRNVLFSAKTVWWLDCVQRLLRNILRRLFCFSLYLHYFVLLT